MIIRPPSLRDRMILPDDPFMSSRHGRAPGRRPLEFLLNPYRFGGGGGGPTDPNFANVSSLLHFDGTNGSTTITDIKAKTWTASGNAQITTAQSVFGGASLLCDGNGDYVSTTTSLSDFQRSAAADLTIEMRIRFNTVGTAQYFLAIGAAGDVLYLVMRRPGSSTNRISMGFASFLDGTTSVTTGVWYALAVSFNSGTVRLYLDGVLEASGANSTNSGTVSYINVGCAPSVAGASAGLNGWMDEFRYTKGVGRYPAAYTPAAAAFPNS